MQSSFKGMMKKKVFSKLRRKKEPEQPQRITTDTIVEHRERMLAGGRRFKYPVQYARHKLVFNAIIVSVAAVILLIVITWWQLYIVQNTSDFMYRVTRVVPVPVASIDGEQVRYSDYLMKYRSSIHYLQEKERINLATDDGKRQADFVKSEAMKDAIADAYATKIAHERNINVSDAELEQFLQEQRTSTDGDVSQATYDAVILDYYGWTPQEYREAMKNKLIRQKVAFAIDTQAEKTSKEVGEKIKAGATDLRVLADQLSTGGAKVTYGALGFLPRTNQDGGVTTAAAKLQKGQISTAIQSTTGEAYYYVKLLDSNDAQVNYEYIQIPLTVLNDRLRQAREAGARISEYISIPEVKTTNQ